MMTDKDEPVVLGRAYWLVEDPRVPPGELWFTGHEIRVGRLEVQRARWPARLWGWLRRKRKLR